MAELTAADLYAKIGLLTVQIDLLQSELSKLKESEDDDKEVGKAPPQR